MIRLVREEDAEAIAVLSTQLGYPADKWDIVERLCRMTKKDAVFVYEQEGEVVG